MHLLWNNSFSKLSIATLLIAMNLNAIPKEPCEPPPPPVCCEEPVPGPFAFAYPFDMDLNCPRDFYIHVDALAMQAKEDGLDFAIQDSSAPGGNTPITNGHLEGFSSDDSDYDYNPGMRVGIGFFLDHDAWNFDLNYTWLNITNYQKASASTALGALLPLYSLGDGTQSDQIGSRASSKWDVKYNTFDITLGKAYYVSRYLVLNPHFGLRGASIDQYFAVDYGGNPSNPINRTVMRAENDFWGVGARAGLDSDFKLGKGWCLFGNIAASMLFGKFEIDQSYSLPGQVNDGYDLDYDFYQNVPNLEIALGIGWGKYFNKKKNHVSLKAAYEFHEWWDQLNIRKFSSGSYGTVAGLVTGTGGMYTNDVIRRGNLTINGFSFRLQFDM